MLVYAHVVSEDEVAPFPALCLQLDDFSYDLCGVAVFARIGLLCHSQALLVFPAASEDGVVACIREILVFSRSFHSLRGFVKKLQEGNRTRKSSV